MQGLFGVTQASQPGGLFGTATNTSTGTAFGAGTGLFGQTNTGFGAVGSVGYTFDYNMKRCLNLLKEFLKKICFSSILLGILCDLILKSY